MRHTLLHSVDDGDETSFIHQQCFTFLGTSTLKRKFTKALTSTTQLVQKPDGRFVLYTSYKYFTQKIEFRTNEEFEEKSLNGKKVKSKIAIVGNTMIHTQNGEKPVTIERRYFDDEMISISTCGDVTSTSWCKLIEK